MGSQRAVRERQLSSESRISLNRLLLAGCCHLRNTSEYLPGAPSRERHGQFPEVPSFALYGEPKKVPRGTFFHYEAEGSRRRRSALQWRTNPSLPRKSISTATAIDSNPISRSKATSTRSLNQRTLAKRFC